MKESSSANGVTVRMSLVSFLRFVIPKFRWRFVVIVTLLLLASVAEILGLASLLPVAGMLFGNLSGAGITSDILRWAGVQHPEAIHYLSFAVTAVLVRGFAVFIAYQMIASVSTKFQSAVAVRAVTALLRARWSFILRTGTGSVVDALTRGVMCMRPRLRFVLIVSMMRQ